MLDKPEKTRELVDALKAALPFEIELTPEAIAGLRAQQPPVVVKPQQIVSQSPTPATKEASFAKSFPRRPRAP